MDDLRLIEDLGSNAPAWGHDDLAGPRGALLAEIERAETGGAETGSSAPAGPAVRPFRWRRRVLGAVVSAAVAAAVVVLVVLATTVFTGSDRAAVQPPTIDTATRQALLAAADAAGKQPDVVPRPDQFLYVSDGPGVEAWYSMDGTHDGVDFGPLPQGGSGWTPEPGCRNGRRAVTKGGKFMPGVTEPCAPDPAYLPDLPTDPQALMAYLDKNDYAEADDPNSVGKSVWDLVHSHYLRPSQWAALFQALAQLPGLRVHQHATDPAGHPAFGISWTNSLHQDGELFFDPHTFRFTGSGGGPGNGTETGPMSIVDHPGERP